MMRPTRRRVMLMGQIINRQPFACLMVPWPLAPSRSLRLRLRAAFGGGCSDRAQRSAQGSASGSIVFRVRSNAGFVKIFMASAPIGTKLTRSIRVANGEAHDDCGFRPERLIMSAHKIKHGFNGRATTRPILVQRLFAMQ